MKEIDIKIDFAEQYGLCVKSIKRIRMGLCLSCQKILEEQYLLTETTLEEKRLEQLGKYQRQIMEAKPFFKLGEYVPTKEGNYLVRDEKENTYVLSRWYDGAECSKTGVNSLLRAAEILGDLHQTPISEEIKESNSLLELVERYERYNREILRTKNYLKNKRRKTEFERNLQTILPQQEEYCIEVAEKMRAFCEKNGKEMGKLSGLVHGEFSYHSVLFADAGMGSREILLPGTKLHCGIQVVDVHHFLRKALEKNYWNPELGNRLCAAYEKQRELMPEEKELLGLLLAYPEKFHKIVNTYMNQRKTLISPKTVEKLALVHNQTEIQRKFCALYTIKS